MRHNIFTISLCIHCTYNVNLYYRHKKIGKYCTHLQNLYNIYHFLCIILTTFMYLQCKLALHVQSKPIKIFKKKKQTKKQKQKQSSNQLAYLKGKKEKKRKEKVHLTN